MHVYIYKYKFVYIYKYIYILTTCIYNIAVLIGAFYGAEFVFAVKCLGSIHKADPDGIRYIVCIFTYIYIHLRMYFHIYI